MPAIKLPLPSYYITELLITDGIEFTVVYITCGGVELSSCRNLFAAEYVPVNFDILMV